MPRNIKQKIFSKLQKLDEYIEYLQKLTKDTKNNKKKFLDDFYLFGTTERYLQLSIQIIIDTVKIIVIEENLEKPDDNQELISVLYNQKIISSKLASKLDGIVGFRNILVHEYGKIDKNIVYQYLHSNTKDFILFKKEILKYINKNS